MSVARRRLVRPGPQEVAAIGGRNLSSQGSNLTGVARTSEELETLERIGESEAEIYLVTMTAHDRTQEFLATVRSMQGYQRNVPRSALQRDPGRAQKLQHYAEFMRIAKVTKFFFFFRMIGRDITSTYTKLEKLTLLAKKKSLFDDKPHEIQELTYIIKQDLSSLNKQIGRLQELVKVSQPSNTRQHHLENHSNSVVVSLQSKLACISNEFKQVLEVRTENLKQQRSRQEKYTQAPVVRNLPPMATSGFPSGSVLLSRGYHDEQGPSDVSIEVPQSMNGPSSALQQQLLVEEDTSYLESRAETMQSIESTVVELGSIFQQLAHMVKEQEEAIHRIDHNVEDTQMNVEAAHSEILKYFRSVSSSRWLMFKVFGVLIVFFIIFVVLLA
ncbi:unnamed protein product [Darwinula stevensoni]|uniref:t-SNARE coiled-coil homology domain-containing protein n=1 Tax=Darwinula stevensoni TaxID=69355 RepID=A0A7R8X454_9CRUS|nr:unnamed protein product [Darwinula stevensoni]CAG0883268.1 unnamed protein product [Darwinula stevensoni]